MFEAEAAGRGTAERRTNVEMFARTAQKLGDMGLGNLGETEKRALQQMVNGSSVLLSSSGQKPRPHFLQLSADFSVLRWSWTGYVLLHELVGLQISRHPNYKTPCITLLMNTYCARATETPIPCVRSRPCRAYESSVAPRHVAAPSEGPH